MIYRDDGRKYPFLVDSFWSMLRGARPSADRGLILLCTYIASPSSEWTAATVRPVGPSAPSVLAETVVCVHDLEFACVRSVRSAPDRLDVLSWSEQQRSRLFSLQSLTLIMT